MPAMRPLSALAWLWRWMRAGLAVGLLLLAVSGSGLALGDPREKVRAYTRLMEFDFLSWTVDAVGLKLGQSGLGISGYLTEPARTALVREYVALVSQAAQLEVRVAETYADPSQPDPAGASRPDRTELERVRRRQDAIQPVVESLLQEQIAVVLSQAGLGIGGQPFPPVAFHMTRVPVALIVSPRDVIRQDANIQLQADLTLEEAIDLERRVEQGLDVSALVVPIGGIGVYPTMVQQTGALSWMIETVVHEWIHNYLTFRPLGLNYETSAELRTMNETVASLLGESFGSDVLARYYPDLLPSTGTEQPSAAPPPAAFDFRAEMRETRVTVDRLLSEGRIDEAEAYLESQRQVFWDQGYRIRRLNQAYFAFYGAYADQPGGAAGEDPVGEAVRQLWALSPTPASFLRRMAWMDDFGDLQRALAELTTTR